MPGKVHRPPAERSERMIAWVEGYRLVKGEVRQQIEIESATRCGASPDLD